MLRARLFAAGLVQSVLSEPLLKHALTQAEADKSGAHALDGSPYVWYQDAGSEDIPDWIIYLEGGGECETHKDCVQRSKTDIGTSTVLPDTVDRNTDVSDGMTSSDATRNPRFHSFGTLYLPYLSGDDWLGLMKEPCVPWGEKQNCTAVARARGADGGKKKALYFAGALNFEATVRRWREGLRQPPRRVLLTGGSAGGQGAYFLAERLRALLPDSTVLKINPQYGWFAPPTDAYKDWKHGRHTDPSLPYPSPASPYDAPAWCYNISLALPSRCVTAAEARGDSPLVCTSTPTVALTMDLPLFVSVNLFDGWLTGDMEMVPDQSKLKKADDPRVQYLLEVTAKATTDSVLAAMAVGTPGTRAAFVPACMEHPMAWRGLDDYWATEGAPTLGKRKCTHGDAVATWFFEETGTDACESVLIDERRTFEELASMPCNADTMKQPSKDALYV